MTRMSRTTIMADDALLDQLRAIADEEGISLGEVIRQGLDARKIPEHLAERDLDAVGLLKSLPGLSQEERVNIQLHEGGAVNRDGDSREFFNSVA